MACCVRGSSSNPKVVEAQICGTGNQPHAKSGSAELAQLCPSELGHDSSTSFGRIYQRVGESGKRGKHNELGGGCLFTNEFCSCGQRIHRPPTTYQSPEDIVYPGSAQQRGSITIDAGDEVGWHVLCCCLAWWQRSTCSALDHNEHESSTSCETYHSTNFV